MKHYILAAFSCFILGASTLVEAHFDSLGKLPGEWIQPPKSLDSTWKFQTSNQEETDSAQLFGGQWSLIYIGYAGCSSTCPLDLTQVKKLYKDHPKLNQNAPFYFISADPKNDTPEKLQHYLNGIHETFTGLQTQGGQTETVLGLFESPLRTLKENNDEILHSSHLYLVGPDLRWWKSYTFPFDEQEILQDVDYMMKQSGLSKKP